MAMIQSAGIIRIGMASQPASVNQFTEFGGRYFLGFVNEHGRAVIYSSTTNGMSWSRIYDLGRATSIAIRGVVAVVRRGEVAFGLSLLTGNFLFTVGDCIVQPIPLPEAAGPRFGEYPISWALQLKFGGVATYVRATENGGGPPEAPLFGPILYLGHKGFSQEAVKAPLRAYYTYTDPFNESTAYPALATLVQGLGGPYWDRHVDPKTLEPVPLQLRTEWAREAAMEGMVNDPGFGGVSVRGTHQVASAFLQADHWSGHNHDQSPIYIPDLRASQFVRVPSTPSGVAGDQVDQRGAVQGFVNGVRRIGLVEPGAGFAHARLDGTGRSQRKYLGNLGSGFSKQRLVMPLNNPTFGMCMFANTETSGDLLDVLWIYDRKPDEIPTSVLVENGLYTERSDDDKPRAKVLGGQYTRW